MIDAASAAASLIEEAKKVICNPDMIFRRIAEGDVNIVAALYMYNESWFLIRDVKGNNLLHIAAMNDHRNVARGIMAFTSHENLWDQKNNDGKTPMDVASNKIRKDIHLMTMKNPLTPDHHTLLNKKFIEERIANPKPNYKVLLSADGGGIKAILEVGILLAIERELKEPLLSRVHWMAGTSCGGIISLALGVGLSLEQARRLFIGIRYKTFCGNHKVFPKHNSKGIEETLRSFFGQNTKMGSITTHKVVVTASKVKYAPPALILFRTYAPRMNVREYEKYGYLDPDKILIWKAARSTSAAPVYFESFHGLADGAIFCNNPCLTLITDFLRLKKLERHRGVPNNDEIGCVITIGSGCEPAVQLGGIDINLNSKIAVSDFRDVWGKGKNLVTLFLYQCTSTHSVTVGQSREWTHSMGVPYFRFSPKLSRAYDLDCTELDSIFDFMFENEVYLRTQVKQDILDVVCVLKSMPKNEMMVYKQPTNATNGSKE